MDEQEQAVIIASTAGHTQSIEKKQNILDAAERLFGEVGFEAVSTRQLAKEAGVNMAMLSYYFGSKEKLFEAMILRRIEEGRTRLAQIVLSNMGPQDKICAVIDYYVDKTFGAGRMHSIFFREISLNQRSDVSGLICSSYLRNMEDVSNIIREGEDRHIFKKVDKELTILMIISTISHVVNSQNMSRRIFDIPANELVNEREDVKERIKIHLKDVILSYLSIKPHTTLKP